MNKLLKQGKSFWDNPVLNLDSAQNFRGDSMWKDIKGWESYYEVSDLGEVRNKKTNKLVFDFKIITC